MSHSQTTSSAMMPVDSTANRSGLLGISNDAWVKIAIIGVAFITLYINNFSRLYYKTMPFIGDPNWSHAICVPLIGFYFLFVHKEELLAAPIEPVLPGAFTKKRFVSVLLVAGAGLLLWLAGRYLIPNREGLVNLIGAVQLAGKAVIAFSALGLLLDWGLACLIGGLMTTAFSIWPGQNDFAWDVSGVIVLFGIILTICGWKVMQIAWFPIVFLVCAIPWPPLIYSQIASPLQELCAKVAVLILQLTGADASVQGTKIFLPQFDPTTHMRMADRALNVAEACAGLRSLMTFVSIGGAVAFLSARPMWQKLLIMVSAIPIAVACNVMRVAGVGALDLYVDRSWSEGFAHQFAGIVMLLPSIFLIVAVGWVLDKMFIEEVEVTRRVRKKTESTPVTGGAV